MSSISEIEKLICKGKGEQDNLLANLIYNLMTNLNQSYKDIMEIPIPLALELLKILDKQNKDMEKQMKKGGRR